MLKIQKPILSPMEDRLLPMGKLGERWYCHPKVALKRAKKLGLDLIRWNERTLAVRLSDVLRAEMEAAGK
jgi:hypothetical protein